MSVGYFADSFDMINVRDLDLIAQARERCSRLMLGVFTDDYAEQLFGRRPVVPLDERKAVLQHIGGVAEVLTHDDPQVTSPSGPRAEAAVVFAAVGTPIPTESATHWLTPRAHSASWRAAPAEMTNARRDRSGASCADAAVVGYVPGAWDMFHVGHLNILRRAREHCDRLVVGVVTDDAVHSAKGKRPVVPLAERMAVVAHLTIVDEVIEDYSSNKLDVWQKVGFDVLFKGDDWRGTAKGDKLEADMASVGVTVHYFPYTKHTSSSLLRSAVSAR
jgi:glycerol-3-phosphate cytidylyltransferase